MVNSINAADNPALASSLIEEALAEPKEQQRQVEIMLPTDTRVVLPGGYLTLEGDVHKEAEVRELNGRDEEAWARATTVVQALNTILSRGVVSIGGVPATEEMLGKLLAGDREALLVGIFKATYGNPAAMECFCNECQEPKEAAVDLDTELNYRGLADPVNDRVFEVDGRKSVYTVTLPDGVAAKEMAEADNGAALVTALLRNTIIKIDGSPVYSPRQVQDIGLADRRAIVKALADRAIGPKFENISAECPDCGSEVVVPVSLRGMFRI